MDTAKQQYPNGCTKNKLQLQKVAIMVRDITNVNLGAKCVDSSREQNYMEAGGKDVPMLKGKWSLYIGCFRNARWDSTHWISFIVILVLMPPFTSSNSISFTMSSAA